MYRPLLTRRLLTCMVALGVCYLILGCYIWWRTARVYELNPYLEGRGAARGDIGGFTPVVIVGYMRSGSSLTGDLIQQQSEVFYAFEPLHDIQKDYIATKESQFPNYRFKGSHPSRILEQEAIPVLRAWFKCDFRYIQAEEKRYHLSFFKYGLKTKQLLQCLNQSLNTGLKYSTRCSIMMRKQCLNSKLRVVKTIRTSLDWLAELMEEYQSMKIIHLVRDPRAIINSQIKYGACDSSHGGVVGCSQYLCSSLEDDLNTFNFFKRLYSDRLLRVHFEDIALRPMETTKLIYKFLGVPFTPQVEMFVFNSTMAGNNPTSILSTIRSNSSDMIDKWRTTLSDNNLRTVQVMCEYVMQKLSYYHFIRPN